jgi:capsule polysaccharide export protein KpsE/RkpR
VEASGPAVVPAYEPSSPRDLQRRYPESAPEPAGGGAERLTLLWRERGFLWRVAWKTAVAAYVVALLLPVHYEGVTKIVPGESPGGGMGLLGKLAGAGGASAGGGLGLGLDPSSLLGLKTPGALYIEIMKSRTVQDRLIDSFDLRRRYTLLGRWFPRAYPGKFPRWMQPGYYETRKKLKSFTDFEEDKKSGVITVTCTDYDRETAAKICNAYVDELNRLAADLNTSDAHRERIFLEERLKSAKQDLDHASLALSQFSSTNQVMDPQSQGRTMMDAASRIQGELIAAEAELKGYQEIYSDDNVKVRTTKARIGELQSQLRKLLGSSASGAAEPAASASALYPSMRTLPILGYQYSDLYRQAKIQETVYEFLTQQYEMAKIQEAKELPTVRTMDRAVKPERKSGPIRTLIAGLSVLGALALACFWIIGRNAWEQLPGDDPRRALAAEVSGDLKALARRMKRGAS